MEFVQPYDMLRTEFGPDFLIVELGVSWRFLSGLRKLVSILQGCRGES